MVNANTLLMESHNFPKTLETDNRAFFEFLDTMAKYHKYDIPQQVSLHLHAPRKASAVATREVWERCFGTEPLSEAEEIPALVKSKDGSYQAVTLYDIQDTAYYRTLAERGILDEIPSVPWQYEESVHGEAVMQALGSSGKGSEEELSSALHQAVLQKVLARRSDFPSLLLAATEYVARERLGLPANPSVLQSIARDGIPMERFLAEVNAEVKEVLSPVAAAVKIIDDQRVEAWEAEHDADRAGDLNEALRGVRERGARTAARGQGDMEGNARGGDARRVSDSVRGREDGAVPESRGQAREELERDRGAQEEGSRGVDAGNEHGADVGARDADARLSAESEKAETAARELSAMAPAEDAVKAETPPASEQEAEAEAPIAETASSETTESNHPEIEQGLSHEYKYYMNHRPLDIGAQPTGFSRFDEEDPRGRYGAIYYTRPLTEKEIQDYELTEAEDNRAHAQEETEEAEATASAEKTANETPEEEAAAAAEPETGDAAPAETNPDDITETAGHVSTEQNPAEPELVRADPIDLSTLDFSADLSTTSGKRAVFRRNLAAIQIIHRLDRMQAKPTDEEKRVLASYEGWGGLPEAFDVRIPAWKAEQDALRAELSDKEYTAARASTLNAHYTPDEIIRGIYGGLHRLGFEQGNILDSAMGTGRFFAAMPPSMREHSHLFGVELDAVSAEISAYLHEDTEVAHQGFETTTFPDNSFDLAITNVPFGNYKVEDNKHRGLSVHNYFTTKMLDEVRPGGLVAVVTSSYTMDQKDPSMRRALARHADLVSAVRLPNTAFSADGTEVVSDILILKKREKVRMPDDMDSLSWLQTEEVNVFDKEGRLHQERINSYFDDHPDHVLGKTVSQSSPFGYRLSVDADDAHPMTGAAIADAISTDARERYVPHTPTEGEEIPVPHQLNDWNEAIPSGFYVQDGTVVYRDYSGTVVPTPLFAEKEKGQILAAITVRDAVRTLYAAELRDCSDEELSTLQQQLQSAYDAYQKKYGRFNEMKRNFKKTFSHDSEYTMLLSLETYDDGKFQRLSDMFTKRTIHAYRPPTHADTPEEALMISMQEHGVVNLPYMAKLTGETEENLVQKLEFHSIYEDMQAHQFVPADEFLSGNVRKKMTFLAEMQRKWEGELHTLASDALYPPMESVYHPFEDHELHSWDIDYRNDTYQLLQTNFQKDMYARIASNPEYLGDTEEMMKLSEEEVKQLVQPENINLLVQYAELDILPRINSWEYVKKR